MTTKDDGISEGKVVEFKSREMETAMPGEVLISMSLKPETIRMAEACFEKLSKIFKDSITNKSQLVAFLIKKEYDHLFPQE